jgi:hypothetical protein
MRPLDDQAIETIVILVFFLKYFSEYTMNMADKKGKD